MRTFAAVSLFSALSAWAQVEKATMRTTGISCGVCAAVSEFKFRRMPGVDNVTISLASESITLAYKPDAAFSPGEIRQTLEPLDVHVVVFHVTARGRIQEHNGRKLSLPEKTPSSCKLTRQPYFPPLHYSG